MKTIVVKYKRQPGRTQEVEQPSRREGSAAQPAVGDYGPNIRVHAPRVVWRQEPSERPLAAPRPEVARQLEEQRQREEFALKQQKKPKAKPKERGIGDGPRKKEFKLSRMRDDARRAGSDPKAEANRIASIVRAAKLHGREPLMTEIAVTERKLGTLRAALEALNADWPDE